MDSTDGTDPASGFARRYGRSPDVVWSAPGRANLIGEHTDYNDGLVLPFAITERTVVAAGRRADDTIRVTSTAYPASAAVYRLPTVTPGQASGWPAYPVGVAWALGWARPLPRAPGTDLFIDSRVPAGAGLSSSAALEMAVAGALTELWGLDLSPAELARAGQRAENDFVGAPTGVMDQYASLLGQPDAAVFLDCRSLAARTVPLPLAAAGLTLLLADTGERHAHAAGGYADRRAACERAASQLGVPALRDVSLADLPRAERRLEPETFRRVRHVVTENARVEATVAALEAGELAAVGQHLTASHASMRDDYEITTAGLDLAVEAAVGAGALGGRMTGGGFGGSALLLAGTAQAAQVAAAVTAAFATAGFAPPAITQVTPGPGAHREPVTTRENLNR